ncbi:hypothetical protein MXE95_01430 [Aeromonas caviae]|uniref:hypothetical protein n=1 Tax=Aeromonas TaxID=642 RepID=UPI002DBB3DF6|nr:hypothetical protein [Aeromonas caviae]MEB5772783.1 hypothetical protein [Aeromonas caviae]MEB6647788.1 hypothetical protein [Aeromonas caviae]
MTMRVLILMASILLSGCGPSVDVLGGNVRGSMQEVFDTNQQYKSYGLKVEKVTLVHEQGNKYKGSAIVIYKGNAHNVMINVTADDNNVVWETPPGALLFIFQSELDKLLNPSAEDKEAERAAFAKEMAADYEAIEKEILREQQRLKEVLSQN